MHRVPVIPGYERGSVNSSIGYDEPKSLRHLSLELAVATLTGENLHDLHPAPGLSGGFQSRTKLPERGTESRVLPDGGLQGTEVPRVGREEIAPLDWFTNQGQMQRFQGPSEGPPVRTQVQWIGTADRPGRTERTSENRHCSARVAAQSRMQKTEASKRGHPTCLRNRALGTYRRWPCPSPPHSTSQLRSQWWLMSCPRACTSRPRDPRPMPRLHPLHTFPLQLFRSGARRFRWREDSPRAGSYRNSSMISERTAGEGRTRDSGRVASGSSPTFRRSRKLWASGFT